MFQKYHRREGYDPVKNFSVKVLFEHKVGRRIPGTPLARENISILELQRPPNKAGRTRDRDTKNIASRQAGGYRQPGNERICPIIAGVKTTSAA